jgi:hypothetical protein
MAVRIRDEFISDKGRNYRVEIHDIDWAGSIKSDLDSSKLEFDWSGDENDVSETIKPSTCNFTLEDDGSGDFAAFRADIASATDNQFQLVAYLKDGASWNLYWVGIIMTDLCSWRNESSPREFEILAKDGLNRLEELKFDEVNSSPFTTSEQTFMYIIKTILSKNGLASFYSGDYIKVSIDWNEVSQTLGLPQRILEYVSIWGDLLKEPPKDSEQKVLTTEPFNCKRILEGLLKILCSRILQSDGAFHIQQVSNFTADTYVEADYDNTGTYTGTQTATIKKSTGSDFYPLSNGIYGYIAALRSTRLTAKGYLDLRGAYIDEVLVNEAQKVYTQTMKLGTILGGGSAYATATILAAHNSLGVDIHLIAEKIGAGGNSISFTSALSTDPIFRQVNAYNAANASARIKLVDPTQSGALITTGNTYSFSGGVTGSGQANRQLEIDFELTNYSQISDAMASNMQFRIDIKLICGANRITNSQANNIEAIWTTVSTDMWSYLIKGNVYTNNVFSILTPEIPFESENNCTLELTVTLQRNSTSVAWPSEDDFGGILSNFRVIAWDGGRTKLGDQVVRVENPDTVYNSIEYDFGDLFIGDDPVVQSSISSKNYLIVDNGSGVTYRSNVWDAGFDTDYNLVTTMLMQAMALRRTTTEKYMGEFAGDYEAWMSIGYDGARWVMNNVRYDAKMDNWNGVWWKINYSRADIVLSEQRLLPPPLGLYPTKKQIVLVNDKPQTAGKGTSVVPYIQGQGAINAIDVDALDNKLFRSGDSMQVYHPTRGELLATFVVASDTAVSDTTIDVVSQTAPREMPYGSPLDHDPKEVVASEEIRGDKVFVMGSQWVNVQSLNETHFTGPSFQLTIDQEFVIFLLPAGTYNVYLPLGSTCLKHGKSIILTIKCTTNFLTLYPHATDTTAGAMIVTNGPISSLIISGGQNISFVWDGTNWQRIGL